MQKIIPRERDLGGFSVRRLLPSPQTRMVGPFIFFDHMGPAEFSPGQGINVRPHPHIHLATVTYLFEGEIHHRDSLGSDQVIRPGAMNWMTAGRGIVHSERTTAETYASGFKLNGIQLWVALPQSVEESEPSFHHHPANSFHEFKRGSVSLKVLLGSFLEVQSPVEVHSDLFYVEVKMPAGSTLELSEAREFAVYVVGGQIEFNNENLAQFSMGISNREHNLLFNAKQDSHLMFLGGKPIGERFIEWNFVSSSKAAIEDAKKSWRDGPSKENARFQVIPGDSKEFIPLPD